MAYAEPIIRHTKFGAVVNMSMKASVPEAAEEAAFGTVNPVPFDPERSVESISAKEPRVLLFRDLLLSLVRRDGRDLTARQLTAFLIVYTREEVQTVSSLADLMNISRPGVTRVMDRLVQFDLMSREDDREDRRRVLARRTERGMDFFRSLTELSQTLLSADDLARGLTGIPAN